MKNNFDFHLERFRDVFDFALISKQIQIITRAWHMLNELGGDAWCTHINK